MIEVIRKAIADEDLETLYTIYEDANAPIEAEVRDELEQVISELAIELFHQSIADGTVLALEEKREQFVLRVVYEIVLGLYASGDLEHAKAEIALLVLSTKDKNFQESMKIHLLAMLTELCYEDFLERFMGANEQHQFFIEHFTDAAYQEYKQEAKIVEQFLASFDKLAKQGR